MGVGVGDEREAIKVSNLTTHGRVGGEAGFKGGEEVSRVTKGFFETVESGFGTKHGKPGSPDMSGNEHGVGVAVFDDFEKFFGVEAKDGAAVGLEVADVGQAGVDLGHGGEVGGDDDVVEFADLASPLVDVGDFDGGDEVMGLVFDSIWELVINWLGDVGFELVESTIDLVELVLHFNYPLGVGEVAGALDVDALGFAPVVEIG